MILQLCIIFSISFLDIFVETVQSFSLCWGLVSKCVSSSICVSTYLNLNMTFLLTPAGYLYYA